MTSNLEGRQGLGVQPERSTRAGDGGDKLDKLSSKSPQTGRFQASYKHNVNELAPGQRQDAPSPYLRAHDCYAQGRYKEALRDLRLLHLQQPLRTDVLLLMGACHFQLRDYEACIQKNQEAIRLDPGFVECYGNMANALKEQGDVDRAIQLYNVALQLRPSFADGWSNLGSAMMRKGQLSSAAECCRRALKLHPNLVDALSNLGNVHKLQGDTAKAYECYLHALHLQPEFAIAWSNLAGLYLEAADFTSAAQLYQEALRLKPDFLEAHLNLGTTYKNMGRLEDAAVCFRCAIKTSPQCATAYGSLAGVYQQLGEQGRAVSVYRAALEMEPGLVEVRNNLGNALKELGRTEEAIQCYKECLATDPWQPHALTNLGNIHLERDHLSAAAVFYRRAISVTSGLAPPFANLGAILKHQGRLEEALLYYDQAVRVDPHASDTLVNRGNALKEAGRVLDAMRDYLAAARLAPGMPEVHANLASCFKDSGHLEPAIHSYRHALTLRPDFPEALGNLVHALQSVCEWEGRDALFVELEAIVRRQLESDALPAVQPFHALAYPWTGELARRLSEQYAQQSLRAAARLELPKLQHPERQTSAARGGAARLRIGYVSSDFGNHPLSHLMASVFGMHTRSQVEVFCYALTPDDGSEWRQRISTEAEHFCDVSSLSSSAIAQRISADAIHIAVDLNGYTKGARSEVFALRPAPVQVAYMGFPSTTGAPYMDYYIADQVVAPPEHADQFSEALAWMPHCYFVNDYKKADADVLLPASRPSRKDYGLPEDKFVFSCFNQMYKIDPDILGAWCNILRRVPGSVLWLLRFPPAAERRLRKHFAARGISEGRVHFTDVAGKKEHIRRSVLADLFLDTPACNAHTTGTDVLWAGCPMVTLPGKRMPSRVAAALCCALGLGEEMVVSSLEEYENRAVEYAQQPKVLEDLVCRLKTARLDSPLFDTKLWVRNVEAGFEHMWARYCQGLPPQSFQIRNRVNEVA